MQTIEETLFANRKTKEKNAPSNLNTALTLILDERRLAVLLKMCSELRFVALVG
jgi:hypothetical protein